MKVTVLTAIVLVVNLFAATTVYDVELSGNDNDTLVLAQQSFIATADSISEVSFFCGRKIVPGRYRFRLADSMGSYITDWIESDSAGLFDYELVSATFDPRVYVKKGTKYRLLVTHSEPQCTTNFYYNSTDPYPGGELIGHPEGCDLAARIKGVNDFPQDIFGCQSCMVITSNNYPDSLTAIDLWQDCVSKMHETGIKWDRVGMCAWQHFQWEDNIPADTVYNWGWCDSLMRYYAQDSIRVLWYFSNSTRWASCCDSIDTLHYDYPGDSTRGEWYDGFPRNLYEPVVEEGGNINPDNYFARYVYKFVQRYGPDGGFWNINPDVPYNPIRYYEMWNEPEYAIRDTGPCSFWSNDSITDPYYRYLRAADTSLRGKQSFMDLYARLCAVGYSAAAKALADNNSDETIYTMAYVPYRSDSSTTIGPGEWLNGLKDRGIDSTCGGFSFHSYQDNHNFQKNIFDSLWVLLREYDFSSKFLWNTEHATGMCTSGVDTAIGFKKQTDAQLKTFITFFSNDKPKGPFAHSSLWAFSTRYFPDSWENTYFSITDTLFNYRHMAHCYKQMTSFLADCRFNQSLVADSLYDSIRVYEFENPQTNKRIYVGWKERGIGGDSIPFNLPLRTNAGKVESIAYDDNPNTVTRSADGCGWVNVHLDTVPTYVCEPVDSALRRPDLVVDSIWTNPAYPRDGDSVTVYALLRNIDAVQATLDTIFVQCYDNGDLLATDTVTIEIEPESTLIVSLDSVWVAAQGTHLFKAVVNSERKFVEHDFGNNARYRLYVVPLRPYGSITINADSTYANAPFVALKLNSVNPNDSLNPTADSMKIWQVYFDPPDTNTEYTFSTGWIGYDSAYCWYLRQGQKSNTIYAQYKVGMENESFAYNDAIIFDKTMPSGPFVINNNDKFTNNPGVTIKNSMTDSRSGMSKMRYGNKHLTNIVVNSALNSPDSWVYDSAVYHDSLALFEIPVTTGGSYFYQAILPESLAAFDDDTLLLWIDVISDSFSGNCRVEFQYIIGDPDSVDPLGDFSCGASIPIPHGTNAHVSHYNLCSLFVYNEPVANWSEARVGVFVRTGAQNKGRLYIDNLRLDVVSPHDDYTAFEGFDSTRSWTLTPGNGIRKVYGQFADGAGNETGVLSDSIVVDTTKPVAVISSPPEDRVLNGNVGITGYAFDYADPVQHFKEYGLYYCHRFESEQWHGIHPDSIFCNPVDSSSPPADLAKWDTRQVTEEHGDGWYYLRLTVSDSASNDRADTVLVYIANERGAKGEIAGFSNDVYGLAAAEEIFVGELGTGKIYRYDSTYQLLDTFALVDSIGIGLPLAMALDGAGKLWVTNIISQYVNRFTPQGNLLLQFTGGFSLPSGITLDEAGNEWIADRLHHKIKKFDGAGNLLYQFGIRGRDPGEIDRPIGVASFDGKIYVADSRNRRISIFDTLGTFVRVIGDSAGLVMPFGLVVDSTGCVFVSDALRNQVIEFGPSGNRLFGIDSILDSPTGLALSSDMKTLYVSDTRNQRVLAYAVRDEPPLSGGGPQAMGEVDINKLSFDIFPSPFSSRLTIKLQGVVGNRLTLKFYDVTGRLIKTFIDNDLVKDDQNIIWDGQDNQQRKCAAGVYFLRLEIGEYKDTRKTILMK